MRSHRVEILPIAEDDIAELSEWIEEHDGRDRADQFVIEMLDAMQSLTTLAHRGSKLADDVAISNLELRQILRHGCRIIYAIDDSTVTIFAILHERRDLESTLIARQAATAPDTRRRRRNTSR